MELNKIHCMDCLKGMALLEEGSIDLIVTDPPYYIENLKEDLKAQTLRKSSKNSIFHADWDSGWASLEDFKTWLKAILSQFKRVLRDKGQVYMFLSYHHLDWAISLIKGMGFRYYKPLIWYKPDTMGVFPNQYGCNYEVILWFRKMGDTGRVVFNIGCGQRDVFKHNSTLKSYREKCGFHPTCKPEKIIRQLIKNGSNEGDLVLDPFMGSGTAAVVAKQAGRHFVGFEMNEEYVKTANRRLGQENLTDFFGGE